MFMKKMKFNKYISIIPLTDKYSLLYNSYTNKYLILSPHLKDIIVKDSFEDIKIMRPALFEQLIQTECLIDQSTDETGLLKERIRNIDENCKIYHLTINPTVNCNFKCWYCYEEHIPKSKMDISTINNIKKLISNQMFVPELELFSLVFFGGEPLLDYWDVVLPIMEYYRSCLDVNKNIKGNISFTTNGYLINEKIIQSLKDNQVNSLQITLDGIKEDHDNTRFPYKGGKSFDKIVTNIIALLNNGFQVILRLNYTQHNASRMKEILPLFTSLGNERKSLLLVNFQQVWQDRDDFGNENEAQEHIDRCIELFSNANIMTFHKYHDYVWNSCYADKRNEAVINYNGDVYKCTARDFTKQNRAGYLSDEGTIIWNKEMQKIRQSIRFTRSECLSCRIAPLCGGSCSQRQIENTNTTTCLFGYNDYQKDKIVLDKFYNDFIKGA